VKCIGALVKGCNVLRLIDRDDHSDDDVSRLNKQGIRVLSRRHIESYLYDDEVLAALCDQEGKPGEIPALLQDKREALEETVRQGKPADDIKSAAGLIYVSTKRRLTLTRVGNDPLAFARNVLAPLLTRNTAVYRDLREAIFGP
jgi:hypothetical protein